MTTIHVEVTAEDIADGTNDDPELPHNRRWGVPVEQALARLTGEQVDIDGGGPDGPNVATIGQGEWTIVVDLPEAANDFLDYRWEKGGDGDPFTFELTVPDWLTDLIRIADQGPL